MNAAKSMQNTRIHSVNKTVQLLHTGQSA